MNDIGYQNNIVLADYDSLGYAADGLVTMFDAEWNTLGDHGVRMHMKQTDTWFDIGQEKLIGNLQSATRKLITFGYDMLDLSKNGSTASNSSDRILKSESKPVMP